jgi:hypothetical protein
MTEENKKPEIKGWRKFLADLGFTRICFMCNGAGTTGLFGARMCKECEGTGKAGLHQWSFATGMLLFMIGAIGAFLYFFYLLIFDPIARGLIFQFFQSLFTFS